MKTSTKTISIDTRATVFTLLASVSAISLGVYIYAVLATVHHAVARENLVGERSELAVRVSELEYKDIALRNTVDLEAALTRGFSEVKSPLYVSRGREALTLNTSGIGSVR